MSPRPASGAPRPQSPLRAVALFVAVSVAAPHAQSLQGALARNSESPSPAASPAPSPEASEVQLLVGRSTVVSVSQPITRVSLTTPNIADALVTSPQQLLLHGKTPGTISMFVWDRSGGITRFEVVVQRDLSELASRLAELFPGEKIAVTSNGKDVVLSGSVSGKYAIDKAAEVATGYVEKKEDVVNLLKQQDGLASRQVLLRVRFAEVSRSALTELGLNLAANGVNDGRWFGRTTTQQFGAPQWDDDGKFVFSDFLNLFLFDSKNNVAGTIRALQNKGLFQSLAEPNLIAEDGKEASFLAGGEYPYPVVQGQGGSTSIAIQFKEYGVRLNFVPTIVGTDLVKLKVAPEVSSLDFANAVTLQGFRVPAISTRRTQTEIELQDGQTFAVAGLMNNTVTSQLSKIPGIGDIPILGLLFRSKAARKDQTELVVMITPTILRRNSSGVSSTVPDMPEPFMNPMDKVLPAPAPWNRDLKPQSSMERAPQAPPAARVAPEGAASPASVATTASPDVTPAQSNSATPEPAGVQAGTPAPQPAPSPVVAPAKPVKATGDKRAARERALAEEHAASERNKADEQARLEKAAADREVQQARALAEKQAREDHARAEKQSAIDREAAEKQARAAAEQEKRDRKAAAAQAKVDAKNAAAEKVRAEKAAKEQARLDAELQKRQAEAARRQAEIDKQRGAEIARAQEKLKLAQKEYESAVGQQKQD